MPTFRSNSSAYTTLTATLTEISRGNGIVGYRCNWLASLGSGTNLGTGASNGRILYLHKASDGSVIASSQIKATSEYWYASHDYSGSFTFSTSVPHAAGNLTIYIQTTDTGVTSCIWTNRTYCTDFDVSYSEYWSAAVAPTSPAIAPAIFEASAVLSWGAATPGINNAITGYILYYRINGGAETPVSKSGTNHTLDTSGIARGATLDFRVVAITAKGDNPGSARSAARRKNSAPYTPTSPTVPKSSYVPGEIIRVSFSNNGDYDSNLLGFEVATDASDTVVGQTLDAGATYCDVDTTGWSQGATVRLRVRSVDAFYVRSGWSTYTVAIVMNSTPNAPAISYPAAGSTVYSKRPHICLTASVINDGPKHIFCLNDGSEKTTAANGERFSCGTADLLSSGQQVVYLPAADYAAGGKAVSARMFDSYLYSDVVQRSFSVGTLSLTDPDLTIPGTKIKAVHITELQTAINVLRAAYGLGAYTFSTVTPGVTMIGNLAIIMELQTALGAVIDQINGWDAGTTIFDISVTWVDPTAAGGGVERVKFRQAVEQLRALITEV